MSVFAVINATPPTLCRTLARTHNGQRLMSIREIALRSGIPKSTVAEIVVRPSWEGIAIDVIQKLASACGVEFGQMHHHKQFLKHGKKSYLVRAPIVQRRAISRMITRLPRQSHP